MLKRLEIRNYRAFKHLAVDQLGRINLFAGKNSSGKTSLLEALFLLAGFGSPGPALNANIIRGVESPTISTEAVRELYWKPMFLNLNKNKKISIKATHESSGDLKTLGDLSLEISIERLKSTEIAEISSNSSGLGPASIDPESLTFAFTGPNIPSDIKIHESRLLLRGNDTIHIESGAPQIEPRFNAALIPSNDQSPDQSPKLLGEVRRQKRGHILLQALQIIEPRLKSVEDNSFSGVPVIMGDVGFRELVPLASLGEGMQHLSWIALGLSMAGMSGGVLLIDEIENGIHHTVMPKVWQFVGETAKLFDVQVFATTHSYECMSDAYTALGADGFVLHRLEASDIGNRCFTYKPSAIKAAIKHDLEFR